MGSDSDVDERDLRLDQGVAVPVTAAHLSDRSTAGIGDPEHGFCWATDMVHVKPAVEDALAAQVVKCLVVPLVILAAA